MGPSVAFTVTAQVRGWQAVLLRSLWVAGGRPWDTCRRCRRRGRRRRRKRRHRPTRCARHARRPRAACGDSARARRLCGALAACEGTLVQTRARGDARVRACGRAGGRAGRDCGPACKVDLRGRRRGRADRRGPGRDRGLDRCPLRHPGACLHPAPDWTRRHRPRTLTPPAPSLLRACAQSWPAAPSLTRFLPPSPPRSGSRTLPTGSTTWPQTAVPHSPRWPLGSCGTPSSAGCYL